MIPGSVQVSDIPPDLKERMKVLTSLETTPYRCCDYLNQPSWTPSTTQGETSQDDGILDITSLASAANGSQGANELWREKICKWNYEVVDHFDFDREVVGISMSYLDRFLSTRRMDHRTFQLASMTTLYLAVKLYEPKTLKMSSLVELSRGYFRERHIAAMERFVLRDLAWRLHPPTPQSIATCIFELPSFSEENLGNSVKKKVVDLANFFMELSVCDYFFVTRKPSSVAIASICNTFDALFSSHDVLARNRLKAIHIAIQSELDDLIPSWRTDEKREIEACQLRLNGIYHHAVSYKHAGGLDSDGRVEGRSPSCVSRLVESTSDSSGEKEVREASETLENPTASPH